MKKKVLVSSLITGAVVLASFGTVLASVMSGVCCFSGSTTIYDYRYDESSYVLNLTKTAKDYTQYTPTNIASYLSKAKRLNLHNKSGSYNYSFTEFSSITKLEYLNVYDSCNQLKIGKYCPDLKRIKFDDNHSQVVYINLTNRESTLMPEIIYDESDAEAYDTDFILDFDYYKGSSVVIPAQYGRDPHIYYGFESSQSLKNVVFLLGTQTIQHYAFSNCKNLETVIIPKTVTTIEYNAFRDCTSLKSIKIPSSVSYIGMNAFKNSGVKDITFGGTVAQWISLVKEYDNSGEFVGNALHLDGALIHCTDGELRVDESKVNPGKYYYNFLGWHQRNNHWFYFDENGDAYLNQIAVIDGKTYGFDGDGHMITGWGEFKGKWYYFNKSGVMQTGWVSDGGKWYYMDSNGVMQTGWVKDGGKWYYMNSSGAMQTGWVSDGGKWYYMNSSGAMQTGWVSDGGKWYYMNASGVMQTGWIQDGGKWYYMESNGVMHTGWLLDGGKWYYLEPGSGAMVTGSKTINGKTYNFNSSGVCLNP